MEIFNSYVKLPEGTTSSSHEKFRTSLDHHWIITGSIRAANIMSEAVASNLRTGQVPGQEQCHSYGKLLAYQRVSANMVLKISY